MSRSRTSPAGPASRSERSTPGSATRRRCSTACRTASSPRRAILGRAHTDSEIVERKEQLIAYICERLQPLLLERRQEISHPDPEAASGFAFRLLLGVLKEAILFGAPDMHGIPRTDDSLGEELTRAFLGYLGVRQSV